MQFFKWQVHIKNLPVASKLAEVQLPTKLEVGYGTLSEGMKQHYIIVHL
jgi:hypothetical protein